jgi:kynurenine formamidase
MPVFPGDPEVAAEPALDVVRDGCAVTAWRLGSHSGTHVDAPSHVVPGGADLDALDLGLFTGPAVVVDVSGAGPGERIGWGAFAEREPAFGPGVVVLVRTGWDARWGGPSYADHPWLDAEVAERLVAAGVRTLGVDALSPDATGSTDLAVHHAVLGAGGVLAENLRDLGAVQAMARPRVALLPLRLAGGDGAPVRAVAWDEG